MEVKWMPSEWLWTAEGHQKNREWSKNDSQLATSPEWKGATG